MSSPPRHVLITGNLGYVGSALMPWYAQHQPQVKVSGYDSGWFVSALLTKGRAPETYLQRQTFADVRELTVEHLRNVDAVVHLAAVSNDPIGHRFEAPTHAINFEATVAIAKLAAQAGVKHFVLASSCSVYGASGEREVDEDAQLVPLSAYARSKIASEHAIFPLAHEDFKVTALRFGTACGFSPRLRLDLVVNDLVANALATGEVKLLSDGQAWRPFIHVHDMCRAIDWAAQRPGKPFVAVNVGSPEMTVKVRDLAQMVAQALGARLNIPSNSASDARSYRVDFSRFRALAPDHQPLSTWPLIIDDLARNLKSVDWCDPLFRSGPLIRLHALQRMIEGGQLDEQLHWQRSERRSA